MTGKLHRPTMTFAGMTRAAIGTTASDRQADTAGGAIAPNGDRHPSPYASCQRRLASPRGSRTSRAGRDPGLRRGDGYGRTTPHDGPQADGAVPVRGNAATDTRSTAGPYGYRFNNAGSPPFAMMLIDVVRSLA